MENQLARAKKFFIATAILIAVAVLPVIGMLIFTGGEFNENSDRGAAWWMLALFFPVIFAAGIASIATFVTGLTLYFGAKKK